MSIKYVVGRIYDSQRVDAVIYRGWSGRFKRGRFELKNVPGVMRYEGEQPDSDFVLYADLFIGKISEYTSHLTSQQPQEQQSKKWSMFESLTNVSVGFILALLIQIVVFPLYGIATSFADNATIAGIFTAVSIIRGYSIRRLFNWLHVVKGVGVDR